uniref:Zinc/iron permease n=1 Tax=Globisporangium ultimum (strain ATCC 200006 / CBS 805.95 / DAOM BR144) TaxID=431595 RepID=K3WIP0_GLOUD
MVLAAADAATASNAHIRMFKYVIMAVLLVITVASSLVPLWISQHGTSTSRHLLTRKLPFATAGVFIGSGLLHLLPDSVKMYNSVLLSMETPPAHWMREFPVIYFLCALGCMVVWSVDLLNMGDSAKMMAVASAARPNYETSICRVQIPAVTTFGLRNRSISADGWKHHSKRADHVGCCSCGTIPPLAKSPFHRATKIEETTCLLLPNGLELVGESSVRRYSFEHEDKTTCMDDESDDTVSGEHPHATVSEHVVFSGESPLLPYLLAALFSVHSLIAGFALGVNSSLDRTAIATTVAIFSHKFIEAMSVGANFARAKQNIDQDRSVAVLTLYSCMTPLGIFLGMLLSSTLQGTHAHVVESVALSIASGSFIYLAFHELSEEDAGQETSAAEKMLLFSIGLGSMAALAVWA